MSSPSDESLTDDTAVQLDGESAPGPTAAELRQMTIREALSPRPEDMIPRFAATAPAVIIGGGMLPAPLLAAKLARHRQDRADRATPATAHPNRATSRRRCWRRSCGAAI